MNDKIVRNEIGSEFWDVPVCPAKNALFPENTRWFISGTSALTYILKEICRTGKVMRAAVPSWCCGCMIDPFYQQGMTVYFYSVYPDEGGGVVCDYTSAPPCDVTLAMSYFGYGQQTVKGSPAGIVIRDLTHALFSDHGAEADYCFGSLRKWAGFWTGGYAWKQGPWETADAIPPLDEAYLSLRRTAMEKKYRYLTGAAEGKDYLPLFERAEDYLDNCAVMAGSGRDVDLAGRLDVDLLRRRRRRNAKLLLAELGEYALFPGVGPDDCPLFVPLLLDTERRNGLRQYLIGEEVYCPIHWGVTESHRLDERQRYLYDHEISIVCDQRYGTREMERILSLVQDYLRKDH